MSGDAVRGLHGAVGRTLGTRVIRGDYLPGALIELDRLGDELGVSKTVTREAMRVLSAKGLVDSRQKRGTIVRERAAGHLLDTDVMTWRREVGTTNDTFLADLSEVRALVRGPSIGRDRRGTGPRRATDVPRRTARAGQARRSRLRPPGSRERFS